MSAMESAQAQQQSNAEGSAQQTEAYTLDRLQVCRLLFRIKRATA